VPLIVPVRLSVSAPMTTIFSALMGALSFTVAAQETSFKPMFNNTVLSGWRALNVAADTFSFKDDMVVTIGQKILRSIWNTHGTLDGLRVNVVGAFHCTRAPVTWVLPNSPPTLPW